MAFYQKGSSSKWASKQEFQLDRISMTLGSLANLYSNSKNPPSPDDLYAMAMDLTDRMWQIGKREDPFPELDAKLQEHFDTNKDRVIGRYYASELWGYLNGRNPASKFLSKQTHDKQSQQVMYWGTLIHCGIQKLFDFEENKYELRVNDEIVISGMIDLELPNGDIVEFKSREDLETFQEVPEWYNFQCQTYLKMKGLEKMRLILIGWGLSRRVYEVKEDEAVWEKVISGLLKYHEAVKKAYKVK